MLPNTSIKVRPAMNILIFLILYLIVAPIFTDYNLKCQEIDNWVANKSHLNSYWYLSALQDTIKQKIIFKHKPLIASSRIELLSSSQFKYLGETNSIGEKGINLKKAMSNNIESIAMVDKAYRKKSSGMPLIIAGGVASFIGLVLLEMYDVETEYSTKPNTSFLWSGVSLGAVGLVSMIIGFQNHSSLTGDLEKAISVYNNSLGKDTSERNNEKQNNFKKR